MISAKIMILGAVGVGKSSLIKRFVRDSFDSEYKTTIGVDIQTCDVALEDETVRLMLWDTDGDFGQRIFDTAYIKGASGAIMIADASRPATIDKLQGLLAAFDSNYPGRPLRAVINKSDLVDVSSLDLKASGLHVSEALFTSAKTGEGVRELFVSLAADVARRRPA